MPFLKRGHGKPTESGRKRRQLVHRMYFYFTFKTKKELNFFMITILFIFEKYSQIYNTSSSIKLKKCSQFNILYLMLFSMSGETRLVYEPPPTDFADVGRLSSVNSVVYRQVRISHETFSTFCTTQRLAHPMDLCIVSKQTFFELELDVTRVAYSCWFVFRRLSYFPLNRTHVVV